MADPRLSNPIFSASYGRYSLGADMYGPFHRIANTTTQTASISQKQVDTGML